MVTLKDPRYRYPPAVQSGVSTGVGAAVGGAGIGARVGLETGAVGAVGAVGAIVGASVLGAAVGPVPNVQTSQNSHREIELLV